MFVNGFDFSIMVRNWLVDSLIEKGETPTFSKFILRKLFFFLLLILRSFMVDYFTEAVNKVLFFGLSWVSLNKRLPVLALPPPDRRNSWSSSIQHWDQMAVHAAWIHPDLTFLQNSWVALIIVYPLWFSISTSKNLRFFSLFFSHS